ncbi:MAG TPA: hypothetical protein VKA10_01355 [Prolixibacteraceae bacterium]|nr:hypothetical protein [Prolixibacteraceae bacterium]
MKIRYFIVLAGMLFMLACSDKNLQVEPLFTNDFPQTWKLMKMTGGMQPTVFAGEEMEWQEKYIFNADSTFTKIRYTDGDTLSVSGSYIFTEENGDQAFLLSYREQNDLIGSCTPLEEYLYFDSDKDNLFSNWWACDGPGLFYKRVD